MKKRSLLIFPLVMMFMFSTNEMANATELMEAFALRVTVLNDGTEYEWEYDSPNRYEYEVGTKVIKGKEAEQEMNQLLKTLKLTEEANVKDLVQRLKKETFPKLERLDIRYMNGESKLFTWVWNAEN
ncbi:hypothetical protein [Bacillus solitudinis]|uniref:hypothetical protein n=1 Tax=Bacillus solitudinis TaxID=2014074 RepID=UPI000C236F14|nr:hypothetical protein [Bacillus solitudinis]